MKNLEQYSKVCNALAKDFVKYLFDRDPDIWRLGLDSWVSGEVGGVLCVNQDFYFSMRDIVDILTHQYSCEDVLDHFDYMVNSIGEKEEYRINLKEFSEMRKGMTLNEFIKFYHKKVDDEKAYRESPEGIAEEEKYIKELKEEYLKDLSKLS